MKKIELTRGLSALVDDTDFERLNKWKWYAQSNNQGTFYAARDEKRGGERTLRLMHNEILGRRESFQVDHKNGNTLDNRRTNLRHASLSQQRANTRIRSDNTSGVRGVFWNPLNQNWRVIIEWEGKRMEIGSFKNFECAVKARSEASEKFFGAFKYNN